MDYRIIPRSEWGARYGSSGFKRPVGGLEKWLHHSVTVAPDTVPPFTDDYAAIRTIEEIGRQRFGSYAFPYTFAVTPAGLIFEGHPIDEVGAHTQGHNTAGAGFVFVGNYENMKPTDAQIQALAWLLQEGKRRGWWRYAELDGGHRDTKATACPGRYAYAAIPEINRRARGAAIPTSSAATPERDWFDMATEKDLRKIVREETLSTMKSGEGRKAIARGAWTTDDVIPAPADADVEKNPYWQGQGVAKSTRAAAFRAERAAKEAVAAVKALADNIGADARKAVEDAMKDVTITLTNEEG